jgi:molybdopterin molybdotransferase
MKPTLHPVSAGEAHRILAGAGAVVGSELVPLEAAAGRVLAEVLVAGEDVPSFPRSVMDGYAVRAADLAAASDAAPVSLAVTGAVVVGTRPAGALGPGQAWAIPTGGHLPDGADAVVMVEHVETRGAVIAVRRSIAAGRNVVGRGEDIPSGTAVLPAGRRLAPADVAALAAFGRTEVPVYLRPRVAILSTGSEICPPGAEVPPGKVRDVNQYALGAQATAAGCAVTYGGIVDDDPATLELAVRATAGAHDVVILSGGSSVGGRDHTPEIFERLGEILFHGVAVRPGRPTLAARAGGTLLLGLPGVPTSAILIFEVFVAPTLRRLGGERGWSPVTMPARLASRHDSEAGREDYLRVRLADHAGELWAEPLPGGSAALASTVAADGLVVVPAEVTGVGEGEWVAVRRLR